VSTAQDQTLRDQPTVGRNRVTSTDKTLPLRLCTLSEWIELIKARPQE
jgi:hypothetical protein